MIRNFHRTRQIDARIGYYDYYRKQYFYRVKRNCDQVFVSRYVTPTGDLCMSNKRVTPLTIGESLDSRFKLKCKLCDFYTNQPLLYERHLSSNNHHIRLNQF